MLAYHYIRKGKRVSIIEPNDNLRTQTSNLLENLGLELSVHTIDWYYENSGTPIDVAIVNEYDYITSKKGFKANLGSI